MRVVLNRWPIDSATAERPALRLHVDQEDAGHPSQADLAEQCLTRPIVGISSFLDARRRAQAYNGCWVLPRGTGPATQAGAPLLTGRTGAPATVTSGRCLARLSSTAGSLGRDSPTAHAHDGQPVTHV